MRCLLAVSLLAAVGAIDFSNVLISIQDKPYNALNRLVEAYFAPELSLWLPRGSTIALFDDVNAQPASLYVVIDMILSDHMLRCQDSDGMCRFPCASQSMATHVEGGAFSLVSRAFSPPSPVQLSDPYPINHNTSSDTLFISGVSVSGVRSAMASFFRALSSSSVPSCRVHAPPPWLHMRGHQFSTWAFAFSPWPSAAVKYINELATFGTNMVELSHISWDPMVVSQVVQYSSLLNAVDFNVSLWFVMDLFTSPGGLNNTEALFSSMIRLDSVFVPGGDGGEVLVPSDMLKVVSQIAVILRKYHPNASVWVSAQQYSAANVTTLMQVIETWVRGFLTGLVYGPHVELSLLQFIDAMPPGYTVRGYPDLCHTIKSQFEVPNWSYAFAFTEGRLVVNPMPEAHAHILSLRGNSSYSPHMVGFGAYSEGLSADFNMMMWSLAAADALPDEAGTGTVFPSPQSIAATYASYFFTTRDMSNSTANVVIALASQLLFGLEDNWAGHSEINPSIPNTQSTLVELLEVTSNHSMIDSNWRLQALAYRADYDSLIHARTAWESAVVAEAYSILSTTNSTNAASVLKQALTALQSPNTNPSLPLFLSDMERLMAAINQSIGLTVLQGQAPDLGFPNWNCSLGDTEFLIDAIGYAYGLLPNVSSALAAVRALLDWSTPVPGGYYDNLGDCDPSAHPHLDPGQGSESDPSFYFTPLVAFTGSNDEPAAAASRASWRTFSQILYFSPLRLIYPGLDSSQAYTLRLVLFSDGSNGDSAVPIRITAGNGRYVLRDYAPPPYPMTVTELPIPLVAVMNGTLTVECNQPGDISGSGRSCQISEAWLEPSAR